MSVVTHGLENLVVPFNPDHLTPQGIDLCVGSMYRMNGKGFLYTDDKQLPEYERLDAYPSHAADWSRLGWHLLPGMYMVEFAEEVRIPLSMMATMHPRSSLLRMGATLNTAVWDAGYQGVSKTTLTVSNPSGIFIEEGARVGHMMFFTLDRAVEGYKGQYQGEKPVGKG
jgi:dUTP pyrophosphatase